MLLYCWALRDFQVLKVSQGKVRTINRLGGILNHHSIAYSLSNICTKNYWNRTTVLLLKLECGPMPNVRHALPNIGGIGGALCSTPQFGWRPLLECRAVMLPRRETRWNLQGCPKLANRSQPLVGRSSPYYKNTWRSFFAIVDTCLSCKDTARQICAMVPKWRFFTSCIEDRRRKIEITGQKYNGLPYYIGRP